MATTEKPGQDAQGRYLYNAAIRFLEAKYGFRLQQLPQYFAEWAAARGKALDTLLQAERQALTDEYAQAPDGETARPEKENFWHWMLDLVSPPGKPIKLPPTFRLNVPKVLATFDTEVAPVREAQVWRLPLW